MPLLYKLKREERNGLINHNYNLWCNLCHAYASINYKKYLTIYDKCDIIEA